MQNRQEIDELKWNIKALRSITEAVSAQTAEIERWIIIKEDTMQVEALD